MPRVVLAGMPVYIIQRGHDKKPIFFYEDDCWRYLNDLKLAASKSFKTSVPLKSLHMTIHKPQLRGNGHTISSDKGRANYSLVNLASRMFG